MQREQPVQQINHTPSDSDGVAESQEWSSAQVPEQDAPSLNPQDVTDGAEALRSAAPRDSGRPARRPYHCSNCGFIGHHRSVCPDAGPVSCLQMAIRAYAAGGLSMEEAGALYGVYGSGVCRAWHRYCRLRAEALRRATAEIVERMAVTP